MKIAIGGFHHETNTFAPTRATYADFERAGAWPGLCRGVAILETVRGINLPVTGFIEAVGGRHDLAPLVWCDASPSAHVETAAYERIAGMMVDDLVAAGPVDAVYLDLHGAMVTEDLEDGEGELLRRMREAVGPEVPVVCSLDLHANVTAEMVAHADALVAYRTYPHVDMAETGAAAAALLERIRREGRPAKAWTQLPFLIPLTWQCTTIEPARALYAGLPAREAGGVWSLSFTPGFPPADIEDCGPAVFGYAADPETAERAVETLAADIAAREGDFAGRLWTPDEAVREAMRLSGQAGRPVLIADTQDNPGAGANSDTVGMLAALVRNGAEGALGMLCDPASAAAAHAAGEGATVALRLGACSGVAGEAPFAADCVVERLGDGRFTATGPMYGGAPMELGPMAAVRIAGTGVRVALASRKAQPADRTMFQCIGIEPAAQKVLVLKSSVHFRADFEPIAAAVLVAIAPGPNTADPADLPYRRLRPGVRLHPLGPARQG